MLNADMKASPPTALTQIFIFYNPHSGDRQGDHIRRFKGQYLRLKTEPTVQLQMYNLLDKKENASGFAHVEHVYQEFNDQSQGKRLLIISAGGDGTFISIIDHLVKMDIDIEKPFIFFSCFPFGTGNDLAQALHWETHIPVGKTKCFEKFYTYIDKRLNGKPIPMDIWCLNIRSRQTDGIKYRSKGELEKVQTFQRMMSNYMTVGLQGTVGYRFEKRRHSSRTMNIIEYVVQSVRIAFSTSMQRVSGMIRQIRTESGNIYKFSDKCSPHTVELVIQNLSGMWGRQVNLWDNCRGTKAVIQPQVDWADRTNWKKSNVGDGYLEMFTLRSRLDYVMKQFKCILPATYLDRLGQISEDFEVDFRPGSNCHLMVDGEFYRVTDLADIMVKRMAKIQIIKNAV
jgi:diacylglycerol kinase family enzyme